MCGVKPRKPVPMGWGVGVNDGLWVRCGAPGNGVAALLARKSSRADVLRAPVGALRTRTASAAALRAELAQRRGRLRGRERVSRARVGAAAIGQ